MSKQPFNSNDLHLRSKGCLPMYRSVNSVTILVNFAKEYGIELDALLTGSGIQSHDLHDPDKYITPWQEMAIFRKILKLIPDPKLGLHVGSRYNISANDKVAIPAMFCDTFIDYIKMMFQYVELTMSYFRYDLKTKDDLVYVKMEELVDLEDLRIFLTDRELMAVYATSNGVLGGNFTYDKIKLAFPQPSHASYYEEVFSCPTAFDAEVTMIVFAKNLLSKPLPMANSLSHHTYTLVCKKFHNRLKEQGTTLDKIQRELLYHKEDLPSFEQLAKRLNVSPRTLRRHLKAEGTSYKLLIKDFLKLKALHLLRMTDHSIGEIATMLGYSNTPNFYHAFKSWTGTTPARYRRMNAAPESRSCY